MERIKISDWQEMALKKDTEAIIRKLNTQEPVFASICWEIVLAVALIIIDHLFDTEEINICIWVFCALLAIAPPIILLIVWFIKWCVRVQKAKAGLLNTKQFVDMFDNQICYWVMISNSYNRMLSSTPAQNKAERIFFFQESSYYENISIDALYKMKPVIHKIFSAEQGEVFKKRIIALYRLESTLELLKQGRQESTQLLNDISSIKTVSEQIEINREYDDRICRFIEDINRYFGSSIEWREKSTV